MSGKKHWEKVYGSKAATNVSWYAPHLERSLELIERSAPDRRARIIDVGGGASTLVDDLLERGFEAVTVLDVSERALAVARGRMGDRAEEVHWMCRDITRVDLPEGTFDLWHDRAVFHFLTDPAARQRYVDNVRRAVKPGGHVIVATFGPGGPERCSGLEVVRYDAEGIHDVFGAPFQAVGSAEETHTTPWGKEQAFVYCMCRVLEP